MSPYFLYFMIFFLDFMTIHRNKRGGGHLCYKKFGCKSHEGSCDEKKKKVVDTQKLKKI
jgi:hypothetical protein